MANGLIDPKLRSQLGRASLGQGLMSIGGGLMGWGAGGGPQALQQGIQGAAGAMDPSRLYQVQMMQNQLAEMAAKRQRDEAWNEQIGLMGGGQPQQPALGGSLVDLPGGGTEPGQMQTAMMAPVQPTPEEVAGGLPTGLLKTLGPDHPLSQRIMMEYYKPPAAQKPTNLMQNLQAAGFAPGTPEYEARAAAAIPGAAGAQREKAQDAEGFWRWVDSGERVFPGVSKPAEQPDPSDVGGMRKEFTAQSKDFRSVRDAFQKVQETAKKPSAAGDLALIFNYMKMLDPGSTVREGEFATAQNTAGVSDQVRSMYNRVRTGERLVPGQRQDFLSQAQNVYNAQAAGQNLLEEEYRGLAGRTGYDPENVVLDYQGNLRGFSPGDTPAAAISAKDLGALPDEQFLGVPLTEDNAEEWLKESERRGLQ